MSARPARDLSLDKLEQIAQRLPVTEVRGSDGGPFRRLVSPRSGADCGETRVLVGGGPVRKVVYHAVVAEQIGLDSHMIFAFTDAGSAIPHWTFDSVVAGGVHAFHLDLIPRADLGAHLAYLDAVYEPITELHEAGRAHPGLTEPAIGPKQRSVMSHWMLAYRVPGEQYREIDPYVQGYLDHWIGLVEAGVDDEVVASLNGTDVAARDDANRSMIFNRAVDPVWDMITPLVGLEQSELLRTDLLTNEVLTDVP